MASIVAAGLAFGNGSAAAAVDNSSSIVDRAQRTVEAIQADTTIDSVPPLDSNPLTREWFHNGSAGFKISGPDASDWKGHITFGYQVGYPATVGGKIKFEYSTPGLGVDLGGADIGVLKIDSLIPKAGVQLEAGFGPGIQTIECAGGDVSGTEGFIRLSGFHATITGVLGQTNIRPFVKLVSADGDTVITYGKPWTL